jgi:hypothetical protein
MDDSCSPSMQPDVGQGWKTGSSETLGSDGSVGLQRRCCPAMTAGATRLCRLSLADAEEAVERTIALQSVGVREESEEAAATPMRKSTAPMIQFRQFPQRCNHPWREFSNRIMCQIQFFQPQTKLDSHPVPARKTVERQN